MTLSRYQPLPGKRLGEGGQTGGSGAPEGKERRSETDESLQRCLSVWMMLLGFPGRAEQTLLPCPFICNLALRGFLMTVIRRKKKTPARCCVEKVIESAP